MFGGGDPKSDPEPENEEKDRYSDENVIWVELTGLFLFGLPDEDKLHRVPIVLRMVLEIVDIVVISVSFDFQSSPLSDRRERSTP